MWWRLWWWWWWWQWWWWWWRWHQLVKSLYSLWQRCRSRCNRRMNAHWLLLAPTGSSFPWSGITCFTAINVTVLFHLVVEVRTGCTCSSLDLLWHFGLLFASGNLPTSFVHRSRLNYTPGYESIIWLDVDNFTVTSFTTTAHIHKKWLVFTDIGFDNFTVTSVTTTAHIHKKWLVLTDTFSREITGIT